ncbi:MAG: hypothetical protein JJU02_15895 [Cryomorphaceae bacterium]|nr:hypothetical protein [Cryomorphaceae bacterium]
MKPIITYNNLICEVHKFIPEFRSYGFPFECEPIVRFGDFVDLLCELIDNDEIDTDLFFRCCAFMDIMVEQGDGAVKNIFDTEVVIGLYSNGFQKDHKYLLTTMKNLKEPALKLIHETLINWLRHSYINFDKNLPLEFQSKNLF